jgi:uncharacterized protein YutE (UPF0331/DUF86 family)
MASGSREQLVVDPDIVARRLLVLNECLAELSRPQAADTHALVADPMLRAAVERWLQLAIEACIDIASHVIASQGWVPPASGKEAFSSLANHGWLQLELATRLGLAAGLRNVLVHDYVAIELPQLARAIGSGLPDLREFAARAADWLRA